MTDRKDIGEFHILLRAGCDLHLLGRFKIHQVFLHQNIRQLIPRHRDHTVSDDAAVPGNGDITGTCAHIHQGDI